jgi:hypothetical protein
MKYLYFTGTAEKPSDMSEVVSSDDSFLIWTKFLCYTGDHDYKTFLHPELWAMAA